VVSFAKSRTFLLALLALAGSGRSLAATAPAVHDLQGDLPSDLPSAIDSPAVSGWVLADLNGDQHADLATALPGRHDATGYTQEVRIRLGAFQQTSFHFQSRGATVELSSLDVDGDHDGDLIIFEPLSSQPIGVWLNDGAGSFHEGRLADFRKLWSEQPGPAWRASVQRIASLAISDERTQSVTRPAAIAAPEPIVTGHAWQHDPARQDARHSDFRPRAPPRNS
jgi:hypothetical protein